LSGTEGISWQVRLSNIFILDQVGEILADRGWPREIWDAATMSATQSHFYKYRSLENQQIAEYVRKTILDNEVYFSDPTTFNDPFDFVPSYKLFSGDLMDRIQIARVASAARPKDSGRQSDEDRFARARILEEAVFEAGRTVASQHGVYCLTVSPDNILMWSHYANYHRGICLRFSTRAYGVRKADRFVTPHRLIFRAAHPVRYSFERPSSDILFDGSEKRIVDLMMTKSIDWKYEQEWRIIARTGSGIYRFPPSYLDGIILGARISSDDTNQLLGWVSASGRKIEILKAHLNNSAFKIDLGLFNRG